MSRVNSSPTLSGLHENKRSHDTPVEELYRLRLTQCRADVQTKVCGVHLDCIDTAKPSLAFCKKGQHRPVTSPPNLPSLQHDDHSRFQTGDLGERIYEQTSIHQSDLDLTDVSDKGGNSLLRVPPRKEGTPLARSSLDRRNSLQSCDGEFVILGSENDILVTQHNDILLTQYSVEESDDYDTDCEPSRKFSKIS